MVFLKQAQDLITDLAKPKLKAEYFIIVNIFHET